MAKRKRRATPVIEGNEIPQVSAEALARAEKDKQELDAIVSSDAEIPTRPKFKCSYNSGYRYYQSIKSELRDWWDEFNTAQTDAGGQKYRTISQFAKAKAKNGQEREYIEEMIGPQPELKDGRTTLRVPWLGDWRERRQNTWDIPVQPKKMKALAQAIRDKVADWDAVRSSAPFLVRELAKITRMHEQLDAAYRGEMFDQDKAPDSVENRTRSEFYLTMYEKIYNLKDRVLERFMTVHGVNPNDPVYNVQVNALAANLGSPEGIAGLREMPSRELETLKLARHLQAHAETFEMPLPETLLPAPKEHQKPSKENGKVQ